MGKTSKKDVTITRSITLDAAMKLKASLTEEVKTLSKVFSTTGSRHTYKEILRVNENLKNITVALLNKNAEIGNNLIIKDIDLLTRQKEAISVTLNKLKKPDTTFAKIKKAVGFGKDKFTDTELEAELTRLQTEISELSNKLTKINSTETITINW